MDDYTELNADGPKAGGPGALQQAQDSGGRAARRADTPVYLKDGNSLLRAIIASEILGPPAALRENHLWTQQPNEPST
jgi:hypothetical protein